MVNTPTTTSIKYLLIEKKAEEYSKWCSDANDVEEYDTEDNCAFEKYYKIHISYAIYDNNRIEQPRVFIERCTRKTKGYVSVSDYHDSCCKTKHTAVYLCRCISESNWNEEFYTQRYIKAVYDLMAQAKQLLFEGWTDRQINEMWNQIGNKENNND